jgi:hypothetical protein
MLRTVTEKCGALGLSGGETTTAAKVSVVGVRAYRGFGVARMVVRWRGVPVASQCSAGRAATPV